MYRSVFLSAAHEDGNGQTFSSAPRAAAGAAAASRAAHRDAGQPRRRGRRPERAAKRSSAHAARDPLQIFLRRPRVRALRGDHAAAGVLPDAHRAGALDREGRGHRRGRRRSSLDRRGRAGQRRRREDGLPARRRLRRGRASALRGGGHQRPRVAADPRHPRGGAARGPRRGGARRLHPGPRAPAPPSRRAAAGALPRRHHRQRRGSGSGQAALPRARAPRRARRAAAGGQSGDRPGGHPRGLQRRAGRDGALQQERAHGGERLRPQRLRCRQV